MAHSIAWVVPGLLLAIGPVVAQSVQPPGVLTDVEIVDAIRQGLDGRKQDHECRVAVGGGAHFVVLLEGPIGRIMRAAREARDHGRAFTPNDVPRVMRQRMLSVSVTGGVWEPQDTPPGWIYFEGEIPRTPPARARTPHATHVRLVGAGGNRPEIPSVSSPRRRLPFSLETGFDLDAVKALNTAVDIHIAGTGAGTCRVTTGALDRLR